MSSRNNLKWKCSSCSKQNESNRNHTPCRNCHTLDSKVNLFRAKALYILGNIKSISTSLIPLKTPFFIYPLSSPIVTFSKRITNNGIWIHFEVDLYDTKQLEKYHIEKIKLDLYKNKSFISTHIIKSLSPYYNVYSHFIQKPYHGSYSGNIFAKCINSDRRSPKQTLFFDLLPPKTKTKTNNNNNNRNNIYEATRKKNKKKKLKDSISSTSSVKPNKQKIIRMDLTNGTKKKALLKKLKLKITEYKKVIMKGCGNSRCTNPYCKSNLVNKNKIYSDKVVSKLTLKMVKLKHKNCSTFKQRKIVKRNKPQPQQQPLRCVHNHLNTEICVMCKLNNMKGYSINEWMLRIKNERILQQQQPPIWECHMCSFHNNLNTQICVMCRHAQKPKPNNNNNKPPPPPTQQRERKNNANNNNNNKPRPQQQPPIWECPICSFHNNLVTQLCVMCKLGQFAQRSKPNNNMKVKRNKNEKILKKCLVLSIIIEDYGNVKSNAIADAMAVDVKLIQNTFGKNGYKYRIIQNKKKSVTVKELYILINETKVELLKNGKLYDGFIFIFSGHGSMAPDNSYSSTLHLNGSCIKVREILENFRNSNKGLSDAFCKPKFFIIDACRGGDRVVVVDDQKENQNNNMEIRSKGTNVSSKYHPDDDIVIMQSNTEGYVSSCDNRNGSYLVNSFTKIFQNNFELMSFDDAVYEIKRNVKKLSNAKQAVVLTSTLNHKVLFKNKATSSI